MTQRVEETLSGWWSLFDGGLWTNVEGDAEAWIGAADAIEAGEFFYSKRLAYDPSDGSLRSPRNSVGAGDQPLVRDREGLVANIREVVGAWVIGRALSGEAPEPSPSPDPEEQPL